MRERVLQAAVQMLASDGVAEFTTRRLASQAHTSAPAVYELFGDKAGVVREVFFEGFRALGRRLEAMSPSGNPRSDLVGVIRVLRVFVRENPVLAELMFSRPFADFDPGPAERRAGDTVREFIVATVRRCIEAGVLAGDATDIAHVLVALAQGLARQETAGWLGSSQTSMDRRWDLAVTAVLRGLMPPPAAGEVTSSRP
jgi:AcrR family transcriptional regulator